MLRKVVFYALDLDMWAPVNQLHCTTISLHMCLTARYLGVTLCSGKMFWCGFAFCSSFNSIFHSAASYQNDRVVLHLVSANCKPYLLYGSECLDLNVTQIRSIEHIWQTVLSHIFYIKGAYARNVSNNVTDIPLDCILLNRRMRFISELCYVKTILACNFYKMKLPNRN